MSSITKGSVQLPDANFLGLFLEKYRSKGLSKAIFCHKISNKKADRLCMKFSSTPNTSVQRCLYPIFQNQCPHFLLSALFWKLFSENYLNLQVRINKMVNKHTVDYHPSPSQITYKSTSSHISMDSEGGLSLQNISWIFPKSVYSTIRFKKINLFILSHAPNQKSPITPQAEGNYPFLRNSVFWRFFLTSSK